MGQQETWLRLCGTRLGCVTGVLWGAGPDSPETKAGGAGSRELGIPWWAAGAEQLVAAPLICLAKGLRWRLAGALRPAVGYGSSHGTGAMQGKRLKSAIPINVSGLVL